MAQQVRLVDDIDQESDADETITWTWGNTAYEIDLSAANAAMFRADMDFYVRHARKQGKARPTIPVKASNKVDVGGNWWETQKGMPAKEAAQRKALREEIRAWGDRNGWPNMGDGRGRIPAALAEAWSKANQAQPAAS